MSVNLATRGMFNTCCSKSVAGGGGAPPYRQNIDEKTIVKVTITKVELTDIKNKKDIQIKLLDL